MSRVRAVLVDALGTLVELQPPGPRLRARLRAETGVDVGAAAADRGFAAEISYYLANQMRGSDPSGLEALRDDCAAVMHEALGVPGLERAAVRRAMLDALEFAPYPDALPALAQLRSRGLAVVVASNWDCSLEHWLERCGLGAGIDGAVSSAVAGAAKPDPAVFEAALAIARAQPSEAVHVGDSLEGDVAGARAAGVRPILLVRAGDPPPGVETVRTLGEVASLL